MSGLQVLLMIITISSAILGNIFKNQVSKNNLKNQSDNLVFNLIGNAFCVVIMAALGGIGKTAPFIIMLAAVFGLANLLASLLLNSALKVGPLSLTSMIVLSGSMITSTAVNTICFTKEMPTMLQFIGVVLILVSMVLVSDAKKDKNITASWLPIVIIAALFNGSLGVIQGIQSSSAYPDQSRQFLFWTFLFGTLFNGVWLAVRRKKEPVTLKLDKRMVLMALVEGATTATQHVINLKLVAELAAVVFFPINSGGRILLTMVVDLIIFRTKLSKRQIWSFIIGFIAIMMLAKVVDAYLPVVIGWFAG